MTQQICLPRCVQPVFPPQCFWSDKICCIKWTMPCGGDAVTLRWDGAFVLLEPFAGFSWGTGAFPSECERPWDGDEFCFVNIEGDTRWYSVSLQQCSDSYPPGHPTHCGPSGYIAHGRMDEGGYLCSSFYYGCEEAGIRDINSTAICNVQDVVGAEEAGCTEWPEFLTELSGLEEGPLTTKEYDAISGTWTKRTTTNHAKPYIRWYCDGFGRIIWEVGWDVYAEVYFTEPLGSEPDDSPVDPDVYECEGGEITLNSCWGYVDSYPISTGETDKNWHKGGPFELQNSVGTGGDTFRSTITPIACNYEPCGESLDCFADCISGSKGCDGMTPAHAPVIFITFSSDADCCLNGTFTMRYSDNAASSGCGGGGGGYTITNPPSCEIAGCTYTLCATLSCAKTPLTDGVDYGAGSNSAHLYIKIVDGGGCEMQSFSYVLGMSCSGGLLSNRSGTMVLDSVCGDAHETDMDWVLHG